jgi:hypothetical protein
MDNFDKCNLPTKLSVVCGRHWGPRG